jgi:serine/threonine protein kinase
MEYVEGENLGAKLERQGPLSEAEAIDLAMQIGRGLAWAHERRLIHRDVKPENIIISPNGRAKLTDLGLAKNLESDTNLTKTMSFFGTPNFMSPEQFEDAKRADALSDLYSLAATLYMAITGEIPFRARTANAIGAIYKKKLINDIAPPRQLVPEISERVSYEILRALRAERRERPASVLEFLEALTGELISPVPEPSVVAPEPPRPSGDERRRARRYASRRKTSCLPLQRKIAALWPGAVVNLSETGLCLELRRRFEPNSILRVVLEGDGTERRSLVVRVMWTKKLARGSWQMGCCFDQPLYPSEVQELC